MLGSTKRLVISAGLAHSGQATSVSTGLTPGQLLRPLPVCSEQDRAALIQSRRLFGMAELPGKGGRMLCRQHPARAAAGCPVRPPPSRARLPGCCGRNRRGKSNPAGVGWLPPLDVVVVVAVLKYVARSPETIGWPNQHSIFSSAGRFSLR